MKYGLTEKEVELIKEVFAKTPEVESVYIYGSRAKNTFKKTSDIDLAIVLQDNSKNILGKLKSELEDLQIIYEIDLTDEADMLSGNFKIEYEHTKQVFYLRGWKMTTLGEVADFCYGKMPDVSRILTDGKFPVFSGYRISGYYDEFNSDEDLIVVARGVGGTGDVKISPPKSFLTNLSIIIRLDEARAYKKYLYYKYLINNLRYLDSGTAQSQIVISDLKNIQLILPPLYEQRAIAAVLSSLDDKIELLREQNKTLEATAQAIFKEWFVNFNFPGATGKMVDSELGKIPVGWRVGKIYECLEIDFGFPFKSELFNEDKLGLPLIRIRDLKNGDPSIYTNEECPKGYIVLPGDILAGMDAEFRAVVWKGRKALLNQRVCRFRPKEKIGHIYILEMMKPHLNFFEKTKFGTTVSHLGKGDLDNIEEIIPSKNIIQKFSDLTGPMFQKIILNNSQIQSLSVIRDALLPKLMKGEVRVKGFNN